MTGIPASGIKRGKAAFSSAVGPDIATTPRKRAAASKSPTQRSLKHLRDLGYLAEVVEKWNPHSKTRKDLYGLIDILAISFGVVVGIQATSGSNVSARIKKITEHENLGRIREANIVLLVHGWRKSAAGKWVLREVDLS